MTGLEEQRCDRCGRPVLRGYTDTHRWTTVEANPADSPRYAYALRWREGGAVLHLMSLADIVRAETLDLRPWLYAPHAVRCPAAVAPVEQLQMAGSR